MQTSLTMAAETVPMDGALNAAHVHLSATPSSHPDGVAMETSGSGGDGRVVVSFVTKMDIASEGETLGPRPEYRTISLSACITSLKNRHKNKSLC